MPKEQQKDCRFLGGISFTEQSVKVWRKGFEILGQAHSGRKLHAVLTDCKNIQAGILKKSQVLRLRCKKVYAECK